MRMHLRKLTDAEIAVCGVAGSVLSLGLALIVAALVPLAWYGRIGVVLVAWVVLWLPACFPLMMALKLTEGEGDGDG